MARTTVIIWSAVLLFFGVIYFFERDGETTDQLSRLATRVFKEGRKADIEKVVIQSRHRRKMVLRRLPEKGEQGVRWVIEGAEDISLDNQAVDDLLSAFDLVVARRTVENGDWARMGLSTPVVIGSFVARDKQVRFRVGGHGPGGDEVYLAIEGDPTVFVVPQSFLFEVNKTVDDLRNKEVLPNGDGPWDRVIVSQSAKAPLKLARRRGRWQVWWNGGWTPADEERVGALFINLKRLSAIGFPQQFHAGKNPVEMKLVDKAGTSTLLRFGGSCGEQGVFVEIARTNRVRCVAQRDMASVNGAVTDFLAHRLLLVEGDQVSSLTIATAGGEATFVRGKSGFVLLDEAVMLDQALVEQVVAQLIGARAVGFETALPAEERRWGQVQVKTPDQTVSVTFFETDNPLRVAAVRDGKAPVLLLDKRVLEGLSGQGAAYAARNWVQFDSHEAVAMETGGVVEQRLVRDHKKWMVTAPISAPTDSIGVPADPVAVKKLLSFLAAPTVERWATAAEKNGLDQTPLAWVRAFDEANGVLSEVHFYGMTSDGLRLAIVTSRPQAVMAVSNNLFELAARPAVSRDLLRLPAEGIYRVRLSLDGKKSVSFERQGGHWKSADCPTGVVQFGRLLVDLQEVRAFYGVGWTLPNASWRVTLEASGADGQLMATLRFGGAVPGARAGTLAKRDGLDVTYAFSDRLVDDLAGLCN